MVIIKTVRDKHIFLRESTTEVTDLNFVVIGTFVWIILVNVVAYGMWSAMDAPKLDFGFTHIIAFIGLGIFASVLMSFPYFRKTQCYVIIGEKSISRIVIKTTPEQDQIAICKASKEIENEINKKYDDDCKLDRIASKCR